MNSIGNLLPRLQQDYPNITFEVGESFFWSPRDNKIYYTTHQTNVDHGVWALMHELAHALLGHVSYENDFELLKLESSTWQYAKVLAKKYCITINNDHVQDCLDTYRDWLYGRSSCPKCGVVSLQNSRNLYRCFNCRTAWQVPSSPRSLISKVIKSK